MSDYARVMSAVLSGHGKSFVVFEHGSVVVLVSAPPGADLAAEATRLMQEHGPVAVGSPAGDFGVITLPDGRGWAVTSHHPDILTLVLPHEVSEAPTDLSVGLYGRAKRNQDASEPRVIHVQDGREQP